MSATPTELFTAAQEIARVATSEPLYRAAISRAYYSTYHACLKYHSNLPQPGTVGMANGAHNQLITQLSYPAPALGQALKITSIAIGKSLRGLCAQRVTSDYDLTTSLSDADMQRAFTTARTILQQV